MAILHAKKRGFLVLLLTIMLVIVAAPVYLNGKVLTDIIRSRYTDNFSRIDIWNKGTKNNTVEIVASDDGIRADFAGWCKTNNGNCVVLKTENNNKWHEFKTTLKAVGDGELSIYLRGPYKMIDNLRYPVLVDYRQVYVNKKMIFKKRMSLYYDNPYSYKVNVKNGDIIKLRFSAKRHNFQLADFKIFYSTLKVLRDVDILMFISVLVLAFLASYKIIQYLSKFKLLEKYSCIDIVMLAVFFVLLYIPMIRISDATKSFQENRMLAEYQPLWQDNHLNYRYGQKFEKWFNDRFFGRDFMLSLYNSINFNISTFVRNGRAIKSSDNMIFNINNFNKLSKPIPENIKKKISDNIAKLQKFANENNIDLYIIIPPCKEDIYKYKVSEIFSNINKKKSIIYDLQKYISKKSKLNIIYPRDIYLHDYKDLTHSYTDHHWTEFGAFLGYGVLMDEIKKKYPQIEKMKESDFNTFYNGKPRLGSFKGLFDRPYYNGSDCKRLGLKSNCPLYPHKYYNHKDIKNLKVERGPIKMSRITHYNKGIDANVTLLGNSYGGFLMEFLPYNFENVQMLRVNNKEKGIKNIYDMNRFEKHILKFKTNILIFYIDSSNIYDLQKLYKD